MNKRRNPFRRRLALVAIPAAVAAACFGGAAVSAPNATVTTITVNTLPIANALPLDLGIQKGFFAAQGIEIKKNTLQSGNDIVLALANNNGDIGYIGYTPAMIGRTQGIPITVVAASETEGTSEADNWQNVVVRGSSSIRTPADLVGKTIALNALKGVAEIVVRGALDKRGVDSSQVKYTVMPFPAMPAALASGLVDAVHTPEPFMSQILAAGGRIVLAPGPELARGRTGCERTRGSCRGSARRSTSHSSTRTAIRTRSVPCCRPRSGTSGCRRGARSSTACSS